MKAFFLLRELKDIYYANLTDLSKKREINFELWAKDFSDIAIILLLFIRAS